MVKELPCPILLLIVSKAEKFITENRENPFFLFFGTHDIHVPRVPHADFKGKSGMGDRGDVILQLDWTVGKIVETLDSLQLSDNTIIIFSSDNGPVIDDGYEDKALELLNGHTPMGIYRGGKYSLFEAGTRVPLIVYWKDQIGPGIQQARFSQIDLLRSMATLLDQSLEDGVTPDSYNAISVLLGKENKDRNFIIQQNLNNALSISKEGWKYMEPGEHPAIEKWTGIELGNSREPQLYLITEDPTEKNNVARKYPAIARKLSFTLDSIRSNN